MKKTVLIARVGSTLVDQNFTGLPRPHFVRPRNDGDCIET